jgi:hypothetical protein
VAIWLNRSFDNHIRDKRHVSEKKHKTLSSCAEQMTQVQPSSDSGAKVGSGLIKGVNHERMKLDPDNIQDQGSQSSKSKSDLRVPSSLLEGVTDPRPETFQGGCESDGQKSLQRYYYSERERYLPLANITRSLKDVIAHVFPGINVKVSKEGEHFIQNPAFCDLTISSQTMHSKGYHGFHHHNDF